MKKSRVRDNVIVIILLIIIILTCLSSLHMYYVSKRKNEIQSSINSIEIATHRVSIYP